MLLILFSLLVFSPCGFLLAELLPVLKDHANGSPCHLPCPMYSFPLEPTVPGLGVENILLEVLKRGQNLDCNVRWL